MSYSLPEPYPSVTFEVYRTVMMNDELDQLDRDRMHEINDGRCALKLPSQPRTESEMEYDRNFEAKVSAIKSRYAAMVEEKGKVYTLNSSRRIV
jgi:hypothetical protein